MPGVAHWLCTATGFITIAMSQLHIWMCGYVLNLLHVACLADLAVNHHVASTWLFVWPWRLDRTCKPLFKQGPLWVACKSLDVCSTQTLRSAQQQNKHKWCHSVCNSEQQQVPDCLDLSVLQPFYTQCHELFVCHRFVGFPNANQTFIHWEVLRIYSLAMIVLNIPFQDMQPVTVNLYKVQGWCICKCTKPMSMTMKKRMLARYCNRSAPIQPFISQYTVLARLLTIFCV